MVDSDIVAAIADIGETIGGLHREMSLLNRRVSLLAETVDGMVWRNVVPLDDGFVGIYHRLGWLIVPQEEYRSLLHLANGVASHEPGTVAVLETIIQSGDTVIDVGAHIGLLSLPIARLVGPNGRLLSLEPNARSAECLRRTLACNGMDDRAQVLEVAASDEDALVSYFAGANSMLGTLLAGGGDSVVTPVRAVRIDSLVPPGTRVNLVKIDAEGFEPKVVCGMARTISENREAFVIAEFGPSHIERFGMELADWFGLFSGVGLNCFVVIDETSGRCRRCAIDDLAEVYSTNLLFYAHDSVEQDRIWSLMTNDRRS